MRNFIITLRGTRPNGDTFTSTRQIDASGYGAAYEAGVALEEWYRKQEDVATCECVERRPSGDPVGTVSAAQAWKGGEA